MIYSACFGVASVPEIKNSTNPLGKILIVGDHNEGYAAFFMDF
jgi:hypothetical protein